MIITDARATAPTGDLACTTHQAVFAHPDLDSPHTRERRHAEQRAVEICYTCPALQACRSWALAIDVHGVAGGLTAHQRATYNPALIPTRPVPEPAPPVRQSAQTTHDSDVTRCQCGAWTLTCRACRTCHQMPASRLPLRPARAA